MPNELICMDKLSYLQVTILRELILQDLGITECESLEELASKIKYDYNKPIPDPICNNNCKERKNSEDGKCTYIKAVFV